MVTMRMCENNIGYRLVGDLAKLGENVGCRRCGFCSIDDGDGFNPNDHIHIRCRKAERHIDVLGKRNDLLGEIFRMLFQFRMHSGTPPFT